MFFTLRQLKIKRSYDVEVSYFLIIMILFFNQIGEARSNLTNKTSIFKPALSQFTYFPGARLALDMASRIQPNATGSMLNIFSFIGVDTYTELQTPRRYWGSMVFQLYYFRMDRLIHPEQIGSATSIFPCIIAPDLVLLPQGRLSLKLGHIWPSYGLRNDVNTTQTLRQLINLQNIGLIIDWGIDLHGQYQDWNYSITVTRGSSQAWPTSGISSDHYLASARLTFDALPLKIGLSGLHGKLSLNQGNSKRWRAGVDLQYEAPISFLLETSLGQNQDISNQAKSYDKPINIVNIIVEMNGRSPLETVILYIQQRFLMEGENYNPPTILGIRYMPLNNFYIASEIEHKTLISDLKQNENIFTKLQLRYRW